ncbi:hypothetical protein E1I21_10230 [Microbacterium oleivorans]|jgi:hypothetical protein|uniref:hypothetical protein n=1 Tax=Microbacterium oleivorans TaxID=273677 RepID=UPI000F8DA10E|nr:hypothetical protein [Microbacterium oleivorans]AZS45274.1 hypothetical protein BWL13_02873 [Microbacterium oleivorans]THE06828.1 hypothetical protein E1I21_10230 [Microbacterium oleivorans]
MKTRRGLLAALITTLAVAGVAGCSSITTGSSGSRAELFDSVQSLTAASSAVAIVDVVDQYSVDESTPITVSTVRPVEVLTPERLGEASKTAIDALPKEVVVRQVPVSLEKSPVMRVGARYLVFLTLSGKDDAAQNDFYVTGGSAGVYEARDDGFVHGPFEEGDTLPETLSMEDLR